MCPFVMVQVDWSIMGREVGSAVDRGPERRDSRRRRSLGSNDRRGGRRERRTNTAVKIRAFHGWRCSSGSGSGSRKIRVVRRGGSISMRPLLMMAVHD